MSDLIECTWTGESFVPSTPFQARRAAERFGEGECILLEAQEERSAKSHRFYFAQLRDLWSNLPERCASEQWAQSPEHLRRYALIQVGFSDTATYPCASAAEAIRWAANMRPVDEFSVVIARGTTVVRYTAKSQAVRAMKREEFRESSTKVLDWIERLLSEEAA